jgi:hypothetical protein
MPFLLFRFANLRGNESSAAHVFSGDGSKEIGESSRGWHLSVRARSSARFSVRM